MTRRFPCIVRVVRAVLIAALVAFPAAAAATPVTLRYEAPEACPPASDFRAGVDGRTPRAEWVAPGEPATQLEVALEVDAEGARGRLVVRERGRPPAAPRVVADATCATVVDALALVAALAIDPQASLSPTRPPTQPQPQPTSPPAPASPTPAPSAQPSPPPDFVAPAVPAWRWSLGAELGLTSALGQGAVQVVPFHADARRFHADWTPSARLGFAVLLPSDLTSAFGTARITRFTGQLSLCPVGLDIEPFRLAPCAGAEVGMIQAEGIDVEQPRTARELWAAALIAVRTSTRLGGPLLLDVEAALAVPITRPRVVVEPDHLVVEAAAAGAVLTAGLGVELP